MIKKKEVTAGSLVNILIWQQVCGTESVEVVLQSVQHYYDSKYNLYESEKMRLYDVHDAKMLYCLT